MIRRGLARSMRQGFAILAGVVACLAVFVGQAAAVDVEKYVDALPIPPVIQPVDHDARGVPIYEVTMTQFTQKLHRDLPPSTVWGYNGLYPGPTFDVRRNEPIWVRWINDLPQKHLFNIDHSVHGAEGDLPDVRAVVHLHGAVVESESDGFPEDWKVPGEFHEYYYPNIQQATTLWYHDHAMGITRLNVYAGLAGFYFVRDQVEDWLNLPSGQYEIPLVLQDRMIDPDGTVVYAVDLSPEFFGDTAVVNGKVWPYLEVEPRKYRFRLLNGSNSRFYNLKLVEYFAGSKTFDENMPGPAFHQIQTDQSLVPVTGLMNDPNDPESPRLLLPPGERADIIVDFSNYAGRSFVLHTNAKTPFKGYDQVDDEVSLTEVMLFKVKGAAQTADASSLPKYPRWNPDLKEADAAHTRDLALIEAEDSQGRLHLLLDGKLWMDPISELPHLWDTEVWNIINTTEDFHPIHMHLAQFLVLSEQPFDVSEYVEHGDVEFTGPPRVPDVVEAGAYEDTIPAAPGKVTKIIANFGYFPGMYVWHCHILEHEDHEMMRPYWVIPPDGALPVWPPMAMGGR